MTLNGLRREGDHRFKGHERGSLVLVAVFGLLLNAVYQSGHEILALALLAAESAAPGVWQLRRNGPGTEAAGSSALAHLVTGEVDPCRTSEGVDAHGGVGGVGVDPGGHGQPSAVDEHLYR